MGRTIRTKEYAALIDKLIKARHEAGLRQIDVAKLVNRPQSYISRMESGEYRVDVLELKRFAKIYRKKIEYFMS